MATRKFTQRSRIREGRPNPLGATWDGLGVNFALYSRNATRVEGPSTISTPESSIVVTVYPTNEELEIARQAMTLV